MQSAEWSQLLYLYSTLISESVLETNVLFVLEMMLAKIPALRLERSERQLRRCETYSRNMQEKKSCKTRGAPCDCGGSRSRWVRVGRSTVRWTPLHTKNNFFFREVFFWRSKKKPRLAPQAIFSENKCLLFQFLMKNLVSRGPTDVPPTFYLASILVLILNHQSPIPPIISQCHAHAPSSGQRNRNPSPSEHLLALGTSLLAPGGATFPTGTAKPSSSLVLV